MVASLAMPVRSTPEMILAALPAFALLCVTESRAQVSYPATIEQFEVASVKRANPSERGQFHMSGGALIIHAATLRLLLQFAYGVMDFQISGGPSWIDNERYDIVAKPNDKEKLAQTTTEPPSGLIDRTRLRLQALLADRFHLMFHRGTKEMTAYALVVSKNGPKLKDTHAQMGEDHLQRGNGELKATNLQMRMLAVTLGRQVGRVVLDETGLKGTYDFELTWVPDRTATSPFAPSDAPAPSSDGPTIFTALQEQLGLKLEPKKEPIEILVIDHVEKASEN